MERIAGNIKNWKWMPGMREAKWGERYEEGDGVWWDHIPDIDDPATQGWLESQVVIAWELDHIRIVHSKNWVEVYIPHTGRRPAYRFAEKTKGKALLAALEAAP